MNGSHVPTLDQPAGQPAGQEVRPGRAPEERRRAALRRMTLGALLAVLVQAGIGMTVNLYVAVPAHHPGAHPADYVSGSLHSVGWALAHGAPALVAHVVLGLLLIVMVLSVAVRALGVGDRAVSVWTSLGGLLVIGAAFNGASFLDFAAASSSLIMALLAFGAVACFGVALFLQALPRPAGGARPPRR